MIAPIRSIHQTSLAPLDHFRSVHHQPHVKHRNGQGKSREPPKVAQLRAFEVEAVSFKVGKHLLYPHPPFIARQGFPGTGQVSCQKPRLLLTALPVQQQVRLVGMKAAQEGVLHPPCLTRSFDQPTQWLPLIPFFFSYQVAALLAQHVVPAPLLQLLKHLYRSELAVADHQNPRSIWRQAPQVAQKRPLLVSRTVALLASDPAPSHRDGPPPVSQAYHQQSMVETDLTPIDYKPDLASPLRRAFQQGAGYRLVPGSNPYGGVLQQTAQAPGCGRKG